MTPDELERAVEDLHRRLEDEALERAERGVCACPCEQPLGPNRYGRRRYLDGHRGRDHARRVRLEAELRGVPVHASLKSLQTPRDTDDRQADAQTSPERPPARRRAPRPGVSVYLPRPELVERLEVLLAGEELLAAPGPRHDDVAELAAAARKARVRLERRRGA